MDLAEAENGFPETVGIQWNVYFKTYAHNINFMRWNLF